MRLVKAIAIVAPVQRSMRTMSIAAALLSFASMTAAQTPASTFADLAGRLKTGETIFVTTDAGERIKGKVGSVSDAQLILKRGKDQRPLTVADVQRIERPRDSLWNGALVGFAAGFGLGVLLASTSDCDKIGCFSGAGFTLSMGSLLGAMGMGIGTAADALSRREPVVFVRAAEGPVKAAIGPLLVPHGAGLRVTIGF